MLKELFLLKIRTESIVETLIGYVDILTDKEPDDGRDRLLRKNLEADRFKTAPTKVCDAKLADGLHYFSTIMLQDWTFAIQYAEEKL